MLRSEVRKYSCGSCEIVTAPATLCKAGPCIWRLGDCERRKAAMQARRGQQVSWAHRARAGSLRAAQQGDLRLE